jgi:competence ComEA-like helix-hairpin-helix protein
VGRRKELFALAVIVSGLALSALAHLPRAPAVVPSAVAGARTRAAAAPKSEAALRALREERPLDVNRATVGDFELLPGVGPALAQRIVAHRSEHGAFTSVDALSQVRGIGPKTLERLRPLVAIVSVAPAVTDRTSTPATR